MNRNQERLAYYCGQLHSEWAQKKALAYLRILAEAEGGKGETDKKPDRAAIRAAAPRPGPALQSES